MEDIGQGSVHVLTDDLRAKIFFKAAEHLCGLGGSNMYKNERSRLGMLFLDKRHALGRFERLKLLIPEALRRQPPCRV
jgi:hypothetical protein